MTWKWLILLGGIIMIKVVTYVSTILISNVIFGQTMNDTSYSGEPFVYTDWQSYTTESTDGQLIHDHIFFLEADGDSLWIGTEGGLVLYHNEQWKSWTTKNGLPWDVIMGIVKDDKTGELWLALFGEGIARFSGGHFEHFTQMNSGLLNDVAYGIDLQGDNVAGVPNVSRRMGSAWEIVDGHPAPPKCDLVTPLIDL